MLPVGPILVTILMILIHFGWVDSALSRFGISARAAQMLLGLVLFGAFMEIPLAPNLSINLGMGLLPLGYAIYLLATADRWYEPVRALAAAGVTAGAVFLMGRMFPPGLPTELNLFHFDAQYLFGAVGGLTGFLAGQSRRSAFCAAVIGILMADLLHFAGLFPSPVTVPVLLRIGGGGFQGTAVVAGIIAVTLADWLGELRPAA